MVNQKKWMFVWRDLPQLRDYRDGLLCVIAETRAVALALAVDAYCGTSPGSSRERLDFLKTLEMREPEVIDRGVAYVMGGG